MIRQLSVLRKILKVCKTICNYMLERQYLFDFELQKIGADQ